MDSIKSFRFDNDNPVLKNFVDKQSNFSSAMKYLILYYCSKHSEVEDLSAKYKEITSYAMMDQIRKNESEEVSLHHPEVEPEEPSSAIPAPDPDSKKKFSATSRGTLKTIKSSMAKKKSDEDTHSISKDYSEYM